MVQQHRTTIRLPDELQARLEWLVFRLKQRQTTPRRGDISATRCIIMALYQWMPGVEAYVERHPRIDGGLEEVTASIRSRSSAKRTAGPEAVPEADLPSVAALALELVQKHPSAAAEIESILKAAGAALDRIRQEQEHAGQTEQLESDTGS